MHSLFRVPFALLLLCACLLPWGARAQHFNLEADRLQRTELRGLFRFHTGDDPRWAEPAFDDSSWPLLRSDRSWSEQGYRGLAGMAWYRFTVDLPEQHGPLALFIPSLGTSYEVFANGRRIGQRGALPPHPRVDRGPGQVLPLPPSLQGRLTVAIRVWHWPHWAVYQPGGILKPLIVGEVGPVQAVRRMAQLESFWRASEENVQILISLLAAVAVLGLFFLQPGDREYLWFGLYELATVARLAVGIAGHFAALPLKPWEVLGILLAAVQSFSLLTFLWTILHQRRDWLFRLGALSLLLYVSIMIPGELEWISVSNFSMLLVLSSMPFQAVVLVTLARASLHRYRRLSWVLVPIAVSFIESLVSGSFWVYESAGHPGFRQRVPWFYELAHWPFPLSVDSLVDIAVQLALLGVLIVRFAQTRRDEQRFASELDAARAVQHVLLPEAVPAIAGLRVEATYQPAGEVGGDFFQIVPLASDAALVAIGDVSGKGVPAALTVSLLVGMLRALARSTQGPAAILAEMNEALVERGSAGFTTCLLCRLDADGTLTVANAGHLAPYLQGEEVALEAGLPLGLAGGAAYPEAVLRLAPRDQLTLLTDGVIEARSRTGELFGFDRTALLTRGTAQEIAHAAQSFGQEDDITVLTVTRVPH